MNDKIEEYKNKNNMGSNKSLIQYASVNNNVADLALLNSKSHKNAEFIKSNQNSVNFKSNFLVNANDSKLSLVDNVDQIDKFNSISEYLIPINNNTNSLTNLTQDD